MAPEGDGQRGRLIEALTSNPETIRRATEIVSWRTGGDALLLARWHLEDELGADPAHGISADAYRGAAEVLRESGRGKEAAALRAIACTDAELEQVNRQWRARYEGRPPTLPERDARDLINSGHIRLGRSEAFMGIDGASYREASHLLPYGDVLPVAVVAAHTSAVEVVTGFAHEGERGAWLMDRIRTRPRPAGSEVSPLSLAPDDRYLARHIPLAGCFTGPECRTAQEERVLARLIQHDDPGGEITAWLAPNTFTSHARAEIYLAWCAVAAQTARPRVGQIRDELARSLLRTPRWALDLVGGRSGELARPYLNRLAITPVSQQQATAAARELAREDAKARRFACDSQPAVTRAACPDPRPGLQQASPGVLGRPPSPGPSARVPGMTPRI